MLAHVPSGSQGFTRLPGVSRSQGMHACYWYWGAGLRMQPNPRSPDLVWPGHLHGTGCLSARARNSGFPIVVWCLCLGLGSAVTPPFLAGVQGACAWARFPALPQHFWLGFVLRAFEVGFSGNLATPGWGLGCVCLDTGFGRAPPFVVCVCGFGFCLHSAFSSLGCWGVWPLAFAASMSCHLLVGLPVGWGVCRGCRGWVSSPPLLFFFPGCGGAVWFSALSCPGFVVFAAACPVLGVLVSVPPSPFVRAAPMSFFFCPPLLYWGVCRRVQGVICSCGLLLSAGCCQVWQGSPPVLFPGAPWVSPSVRPGWEFRPPLGEWVRGFVAVCLSLATPLLSRLCCVFVAVGACAWLGRAPAPWVGWVMYTLGLVAFPVGLGSGFAGGGVAPGGG